MTYRDGQFAIRFPLTITPRFIPGEAVKQKVDFREGWGAPTQIVPDAHLITPWQDPFDSHELKIHGVIKSGIGLESYGSPSHNIGYNVNGQVIQFELEPSEVRFRDFVMTWQPAPSEAPVAAYFSETVENEEYGILMLMPPELNQQTDLHRLPREMIFVIDTSGSMGGTSIQQAKQSLLYSLDRLSPFDSFNIIEFNSSHRALFYTPRDANQTNVQAAREFVQGLSAGGGTLMYPALELALVNASTQRLRQIVFITDGAVGNEAQLIQLISEQLKDSRLFTVGIGSAPNGYFMRAAAEFGRGTYTYVSATQEVSTRMSQLFEKLSKPVAKNIEVDWPEDWHSFPEFGADLYAGEPMLIAVKEGSEVEEITVRGVTAMQPWEQTLKLSQTSRGQGVSTLWARSKLKHLLDQKHRGAKEDDIRPEALKLALAHKLLSPYTSFIAVEEEVVRPANSDLKKRLVPSPVPEVQTLKVMMPQTHSGWWLWITVGLLLSIVSFISYRSV